MAVDDSYTKALLHLNGPQDGYVFIDESGKTWTRYGNVAFDTTIYKFGGSSASFAGADWFIYSDDSPDWNLGATWTIDFWIYWITCSNATRYNLMGQYLDGTHYARLLRDGDNTLKFDLYDGATDLGSYTCPWTPSTGQWIHVEIGRNNSSTCYMFLNGISQSVTQVTAFGTYPDIASFFSIGAINYLNGANCRLQEVRISKGICRHTSNFIPPTAPYGTSSILIPMWFY